MKYRVILNLCTRYLFMPMMITAEGFILDTPLTARERSVLELMATGCEVKAIGYQLRISPETVKKHLKNCYRKLGVHNRVDAIRKAGLF